MAQASNPEPGRRAVPKQKRSGRANAWAWPAMGTSVVLILAAAGLYIFKSLRDLPIETAEKTSTALTEAGKLMIAVASAFNQGTVTTSFISYAASLSSNHYLQFASLRQTELFSQTDQATTGFGRIPLPELIVEARAPVEYTYYLDLNAKWELRLEDQTIYVVAPPIQFNTPAVDASQIEYEIRKDSVFRDGDKAKENLKQSVTLLAKLRARENIALVRELGRRQTEEFVEKWLAKAFLDGKNYPVKVFFPGEPLPEPLADLAPPKN